MRFESPLIEGRLLRRYKRFLADVELINGDRVVAHCANPGAMTTCAEVGSPVWLSRATNPKRKLKYTWELAQVGDDLLSVNTTVANHLVAEALATDSIAPLSGYDHLDREVRYRNSRLDFRLSHSGRKPCWVEVKTVTLRDCEGQCAFPDSVTVRGRRHLDDLIALANDNYRAVLLFVCTRTRTNSIRPASEIDPKYAQTLIKAVSQGVEALALGCSISPQSITINRRLTINLENQPC